MRIREKVIIAYVGLLVLLLLLAGVGLSLTSEFSRNLTRTNLDNNRIINNSVSLLNSIPSLGRVAYFGPTQDLKDSPSIEEIIAGMDQRMDLLKNSLRHEQTRASRAKLAETWQRYRDFSRQLYSQSPGPERDAFLINTVQPAQQELREVLGTIVTTNLTLINDEIVRSQKSLRRDQLVLLTLTALGIFLCIVFLAALGRLFVEPTRELAEAINALARDKELKLGLPRARSDEIGAVAAALRRLVDSVREARKDDALAIRQLERRSEQAMDSIPDALLIVDTDERILYMNRTARNLLENRKLGTIANIPWPQLRALFDACMKTCQSQATLDLDKAIQIFIGGEECFYLPNALPVLNEKGAIEEVVLVLRDVSYLHQLDEMKTDLIATVSHQLKTPLTSIRMSLHMLRGSRESSLSGVETELLELGLDETERLQTTIQNLLDMARIQSGAIQMQIERTDTVSWLRETSEFYRSMLAENGIDLEIRIDPFLPPLDIDAPRMGAVIDNLMTNCAKYCRRGDKVNLTAALDPTDPSTVVISVADTGPGIPPSDVARIFDRFYRGKSHAQPGAGLGLSIAQRIVLAHGGELSCDSVEGRGTTFTIVLHAEMT